jgi:hypothetical protein
MYLPLVPLPSGSRLSLTAKSYANVARSAEDHAVMLRGEARAGNSHPRTVFDFYSGASADLAAIKAATEAELAVLDQAIAILDGAPASASSHPLLSTAKEMKFTASAFGAASSELARDKAVSLLAETRTQLKATRDALLRSLTDHAHREEAIRNKCADAFRASFANYTGPFRVSLKQAGELLALPGIPDDPTELPAPSFDPALPGDHPARKAAVLARICSSREAESRLQAEHRATKLKRLQESRNVVADELAILGDA